MKPTRPTLIALMLAALPLFTAGTASADLIGDSRRALQQLVAQNPAAAKCKSKAVAVLVFPDVVKAGFILWRSRRPGNSFHAWPTEWPLPDRSRLLWFASRRPKNGYALFLMNQKAVNWVNNTRGWEIGTGPSVVIVDKGMARSFSTDTLHSGIYAFTFDQQGLMAGLGLQGSKIMRLD